MFSCPTYIVVYIIYMVVCLYFTRMYNICTSTLQSKYTWANGNPPFSKHGKGKHIYLPSTWGDGVEPLRFRESTSLSEKEKIRARLFSILCDCEVALFAHISYVIDCYCIMFRNYSFVMFVVRPKRFCPFDPFGVCFCLFDHALVFGYAFVLHIHSHYAGRCLNPESLRVFWLLFADVMCECVKPCLRKMRAWEQQEFF